MQYLFCLFTTDIHPAMQTATIKSQSRFVIQIFAAQSYRHTIQALGSGRCKWRPLHAAGQVHMPYPWKNGIQRAVISQRYSPTCWGNDQHHGTLPRSQPAISMVCEYPLFCQ